METSTNPTPDETNENTTPIAPKEPVSLRQLLARAGRVYDMTIAAALEEAELDDLPMRGVSILRRINEGGASTPLTNVLREGRISRQHGTQLIDTLVERGYIVRETDPEDRRRMRVSLTERGQAAADAVRTAVDGLNASLGEKVTPEQLEASRTVLSALIELAPQGAGDGGWGPGPERGFFPRGREHGPRPDRGFGRGPRGPMRDFDPRAEGRGRGRERMQAFAEAPDSDERGERRSRHDRAAFAENRDGGEREERSFGPRGRHEHDRGHRCGQRGRRGATPVIVHHAETVIVHAGSGSEGRGRRGHHGWGRGERPFGPWRGENTRTETPQADTPTAE